MGRLDGLSAGAGRFDPGRAAKQTEAACQPAAGAGQQVEGGGLNGLTGNAHRRQALPKSSPKRIAAKKAWERPPPRLSFSERLLRIHALSVKKHHNLFIGRHLPNPAFYRAVFQNALAGAP